MKLSNRARHGERATVIQRDLELGQRGGRHRQIEPSRLRRDRRSNTGGHYQEPKEPHVAQKSRILQFPFNEQALGGRAPEVRYHAPLEFVP